MRNLKLKPEASAKLNDVTVHVTVNEDGSVGLKIVNGNNVIKRILSPETEYQD